MQKHRFLSLRTLLMILCVVIGLGVTTTLIQAQEIVFFGLTVSPPVSYLSLKPGQSFDYPIQLKYEGDKAITVNPTLVDFQPADRGHGVELLETHSFPYLDPNRPNPFQQTLTLEPNSQTVVTVPIKVPQSAITHEYHLTVLFKADPPDNLDPALNQAHVSGTIGSNLIVLVSPDERDLSQLSIKSIQGQKIVDSFGQINLRAIASNTGPTATIASGSATLRDSRGNIVQKYQIFPDVVLANSTRQLRVVDPQGPGLDSTSEPPQPLESFTYDQAFLLGPYTLTIELVDANLAPRTAVSQVVWALPIAIAIVILLSLTFVGGYYLLVKKMPLGKRFKTY